MKSIGHNANGITRFGVWWYCSHVGRFSGCRVRYALGGLIERFRAYDPDSQPWLCRWLGLSGYDRLE